jgi:hypothetical protein
MNNEPDLKQIERKAYMSYHQDGLLDIFVGLYILVFGLGIFTMIIWDYTFGIILPGILVVTALPIWMGTKRKITNPRIGFVNFGLRGASKVTAIFTGIMVLGLGAMFVFTFAMVQSESRQWLDLIFQNGMLIVGFGSLAVSLLFGYSMGLKRLYAYGMLSVISLVIGHFVGFSFAYILIALGAVIMVTGIALLIGFVKKYPLKGEKVIVE